jgi:hypothetical protein
MSDGPQNNNAQRRDRDSLRLKAMEHFTQKETRKAAIFREMETERTISDEKTAKLRALRLARDAADAERVAAESAVKAPKKKRPKVINTN